MPRARKSRKWKLCSLGEIVASGADCFLNHPLRNWILRKGAQSDKYRNCNVRLPYKPEIIQEGDQKWHKSHNLQKWKSSKRQCSNFPKFTPKLQADKKTKPKAGDINNREWPPETASKTQLQESSDPWVRKPTKNKLINRINQIKVTPKKQRIPTEKPKEP